MEVKYGKLVRDNIPDIIRLNGETPTVKVLTREDALKELTKKLQEEVDEYKNSGEVEELADVVEVVYGILNNVGVKIKKFEKLRKHKAKINGAFKQGIYLHSVDEKEEPEKLENQNLSEDKTKNK